jgi:DNA-binding FrmR family transcriptional regulator
VDNVAGGVMEKVKIVTQLRRIEGQLRGIETMIESERGLVPTMQQLMAAQASLRKVMTNYAQLFLQQNEDGAIVLTQEQANYILRLIEK